MRKILSGLGLAAALLSICGTMGCIHPLSEPSIDEAKGVRVLDQPDPRTLKIYGHVTAMRTIDPGEWQRAEELTLESLKTAAKREFPDTTVLFDVFLQPGDDRYTFEATGIAAKRRGS